LGEQNERSPYENTEGGITKDAYWGNDFPKMTFFQETHFFIMMFPYENISHFPRKTLPSFPEKMLPSFLGNLLP